MNPDPIPFSPEKRRKRGPVPRANTRMTAVVLDDDLLDWGKSQPGGLSGTVRQLLRAAMESNNTR